LHGVTERNQLCSEMSGVAKCQSYLLAVRTPCAAEARVTFAST